MSEETSTQIEEPSKPEDTQIPAPESLGCRKQVPYFLLRALSIVLLGWGASLFVEIFGIIMQMDGGAEVWIALIFAVSTVLGISIRGQDVTNAMEKLVDNKGFRALLLSCSVIFLAFLTSIFVSLIIFTHFLLGERAFEDQNYQESYQHFMSSEQLADRTFIISISQSIVERIVSVIIPTDFGPEIYYYLGRLDTIHGRYDDAIMHFNSGLDQNECHIYLFWRLGEVYILTQNYSSAMASINEGIRIFEDYSNRLNLCENQVPFNESYFRLYAGELYTLQATLLQNIVKPDSPEAPGLLVLISESLDIAETKVEELESLLLDNEVSNDVNPDNIDSLKWRILVQRLLIAYAAKNDVSSLMVELENLDPQFSHADPLTRYQINAIREASK